MTEVDSALRNGFAGIRFSPRLEDHFERDTGPARARHLVVTNYVGILTYAAFLASDFWMVPDVFGIAVMVRLGIVVPICLLCVAVLQRDPHPAIREGLEAAIVAIAGLSIVLLIALSSDPNSIHYSSGILLVLAFAAIVVRMRFKHAVVTMTLIVVAEAASLFLRSDAPATIAGYYLLLLGSASVFMLVAIYTIDRDSRREYLYNLRERLRTEALTEANDRLVALSHLDSLTGIPNRRQMDGELRSLCADGAEPFGVIMIDVDCFKPFNDRYGHTVGDDCLRRVAGMLQASLRFPRDRVARFGGEEFVALLPATELEDALAVANRMRQSIKDLAIPHDASPIATVVTISAGVVVAAPGSEPEAVLTSADAALYRAKAAGRDRVVGPWPALASSTAA